MKTVKFTLYPYAVQYGSISIPDNILEEDYPDYIFNHLKEADIDEPELDYTGTDVEFE